MPAGYFSHGYVKQTEWQNSWMMSARLNYAPVVDVRRGKPSSSSGGATSSDTVAATLEVSKYSTKGTDLIGMGSSLPEYHRQMKGLRLSASSASLKPYLSDTPRFLRCSRHWLLDRPNRSAIFGLITRLLDPRPIRVGGRREKAFCVPVLGPEKGPFRLSLITCRQRAGV